MSGQLMSLGKSSQVGSAGDLSSSKGQAQGGQLSESVRPAPIQFWGWGWVPELPPCALQPALNSSASPFCSSSSPHKARITIADASAHPREEAEPAQDQLCLQPGQKCGSNSMGPDPASDQGRDPKPAIKSSVSPSGNWTLPQWDSDCH